MTTWFLLVATENGDRHEADSCLAPCRSVAEACFSHRHPYLCLHNDCAVLTLEEMREEVLECVAA